MFDWKCLEMYSEKRFAGCVCALVIGRGYLAGSVRQEVFGQKCFSIVPQEVFDRKCTGICIQPEMFAREIYGDKHFSRSV